MMKNQSRKISAVKSNWYIWLFPVIAIAISVWLFKEFYRQTGPEIKIMFNDATGIQAEKTRIRYRGVTVGVVKKVTLSEDRQGAIAHVTMQRDAAAFAVEGSRFALVMPKVGFQGVSGLETLFEGTYITVVPGKPENDEKTEFKGQLDTDNNDPLDDTTPYTLESDQLGSVSTGDPVTFRGLKIGSVSRVILEKDSRIVLVRISIENKYTRVIRTNTVFWRKVAVQAKLGLFASELKINSLDSLMNGGIELFTPDNPGPMAKPLARFGLNNNAPENWQKWNPALEFP